MVGSMAGVDDVWKSLAQVNDWIKVADAKAVALLAGSGILGGFVVRALPAWREWGTAPWYHSFLLLSTASLSLAIFLSLSALMPKLKAGEPRSLVYFDHIARRYEDFKPFKKNYLAMINRDEQLREQLTEQLWATSRVARRKFVRVTYALLAAVAAIILAGISGILKGGWG